MPEALKKITEEIKISAAANAEIKKEIKSLLDLKGKIEKYSNENVSALAEIILGSAVHLDASDVHLETEETTAALRFRIDGVLQDVAVIDKTAYAKLLSRIKLLSEIKLNIADRPQDGRFSVVIEGATVEIRTSTLPAEYGESIVLRVLNPQSLISLEELGLREDLFALFAEEIKKPNGMIIVTGPTGSGKTTTLYAFLKKIQNPEVKIITIEDPIEYHLKGISQTQTAAEKGYDFASGLKSIMRQDPDVILVGEIRDLETAEIGLQAALTGHLVLTTLHTNDAAGTIARLTSLGAKTANIGPALNMIVAQRLVRKTCKQCRKLAAAPEATLKKINASLKGLPKQVKAPAVDKIPQVKGCKECNFTGYKGRVGIFEVIIIDDDMENFILTTPSIVAFRKEAVKKGMATMYQDGIIKVIEGTTTMEEIERVTGE